MRTKLFFSGLALVALTTIASAQSTTPATDRNDGQRAAYVDANNNGVCDNYENNTGMHRGYAAGQGKGQCKGNGQGKGMAAGQNRRNTKGSMMNGRNFVDKNEDGICDNRQTVPAK